MKWNMQCMNETGTFCWWGAVLLLQDGWVGYVDNIIINYCCMSSKESINCSKECNHNHSLIQHAAGYDNDHDMICPSTYTYLTGTHSISQD